MKSVTVHVAGKLNLEACQAVLASVLKKTGHPNCYSGFNISFLNAVDPAESVLSVAAGSHEAVELGQ
jgi:hypothetical protein